MKKMEINIEQILQKINVNKLVEQEIEQRIVDSSEFEDMVDGLLENEETKNLIYNKLVNIIQDHLNTEEGKKSVIEKFEEQLTDTDILTNEKIVDLLTEFLKNSLKTRSV